MQLWTHGYYGKGTLSRRQPNLTVFERRPLAAPQPAVPASNGPSSAAAAAPAAAASLPAAPTPPPHPPRKKARMAAPIASASAPAPSPAVAAPSPARVSDTEGQNPVTEATDTDAEDVGGMAVGFADPLTE
jgi:hypothetical protein